LRHTHDRSNIGGDFFYTLVSTFGSTGTYSATTTYTPTYGITGYIPQTGERVTYFRFVLLDAYDIASYQRDGKLVQVWRTTVTSIGGSGDLRRVFPVMITAAQPFLGTNSGKKVEIGLEEDAPSVLQVKGVAPEKAK
jgi:hypothetical protein